jgi:hypothetical protein
MAAHPSPGPSRPAVSNAVSKRPANPPPMQERRMAAHPIGVGRLRLMGRRSKRPVNGPADDLGGYWRDAAP